MDTSNYFSSITPAESKREKTHLKLIDASIDLLYEKGFHNSSIKEICEISGVANGTFYNHFVDKEDIYSQAAIYISRILATHVTQKKSEQFYWILVADVLILGYMGAMPAEGLYLLIGRVATAYYFLHFLVILPVLGFKEKTIPVPLSITEPILGGSSNLALAKNKESLDK